MRFGDAQITAILAGARAFGVYPFPGHTAGEQAEGSPPRIAVRALSEVELDEVRLAAQRDVRDYARTRGWEPGSTVDLDPDLLSRSVERHLLFRSLYDADTIDSDDPVRFFTKPDEVKSLPSTTATLLAKLYLEHQEWVSPLADLDPDGVKELVEALGKAPRPEVFLGAFAPSTLRRCVISLARSLRET